MTTPEIHEAAPATPTSVGPAARRSFSATHVAWALVVLATVLLVIVTLDAERGRRTSAATLRRANAEIARLRSSLAGDARRADESSQEIARLTQDRDALAADRARLATDVDTLSTRVQQAEEQQARLADRLRASIASDVGELETTGQGRAQRVTLKLVDQVLFKLGEAELTPRGIAVLDRVAEALRAFPDQQVWVQGYTDTTPIRDTTRFASNWELSTARAASVVHYLQDHASIDPRRLAVVGFGQYRPVSRSHASRNRRIEIVLFPEDVRVVRD